MPPPPLSLGVLGGKRGENRNKTRPQSHKVGGLWPRIHVRRCSGEKWALKEGFVSPSFFSFSVCIAKSLQSAETHRDSALQPRRNENKKGWGLRGAGTKKKGEGKERKKGGEGEEKENKCWGGGGEENTWGKNRESVKTLRRKRLKIKAAMRCRR